MVAKSAGLNDKKKDEKKSSSKETTKKTESKKAVASKSVEEKGDAKNTKKNSEQVKEKKTAKTSVEKTAVKKLKAVISDAKQADTKSNKDSKKVVDVAKKSDNKSNVDEQVVMNADTKEKKAAGSFADVSKKTKVISASVGNIAGKSVGKIGEVKNGTAYATGRRKRAIAKVACQERRGEPVKVSVNKLDYKSYFTNLLNQQAVFSPFVLLGINTGYVVRAEVFGGGKSGQADALKLGISRCLSLLSDEFNAILRKNSYLTRDARKVEPKKAGLRKARKKEQFSKR